MQLTATGPHTLFSDPTFSVLEGLGLAVLPSSANPTFRLYEGPFSIFTTSLYHTLKLRITAHPIQPISSPPDMAASTGITNPKSDPFSFLTPDPVLIVGSGPTGLVASLWLHRFNVPYRLIDRLPGPGLTSRAVVIHARTLEFYAQLGFADRLVAKGTQVQGVVFSRGGSAVAQLAFTRSGQGLSEFPYVMSLPQDVHEQILVDVLTEQGLKVERGTELVSAVENGDAVQCTLKNLDTGNEEQFTAGYVIGADGAHSKVRHEAGIGMEGGTYAQRFYVADVDLASELPARSNLNMNVGEREFCFLVPLDTHKHARLIGFVAADKQDEEGNQVSGSEELTFEDVRKSVRASAPNIQIEKVRWFSTYRVHHRVAGAFRSTTHDGKSGRLFLAGDASHLHSPAGGQGLNTGIGDATNLAWKLAAAYHGTAPADILQTYSQERMAFAKALVDSTDRMFSLITDQGLWGWALRNILMPYVLPLIWKIGGDKLSCTAWLRVSQILIKYPQSALSQNVLNRSGIAPRPAGGKVKAGDRLPWVDGVLSDAASGGKLGETVDVSNFAPLKECAWQVHVYGDCPKSLEHDLADRGVPLHVFPFSPAVAEKGIAKDAVYVLRPDGYVGQVSRVDEEAGTLERYLERWEIGVRN